jgi:lactoylglutathione lyase
VLGAPFGALGAVSFATVRTAPLVTGVNAIYLYVADLDRSIAFYRDVLGIPLQRHPQDPGWAEATFPTGVRFALHTARPESVKGSGSVNIDLEVDDIDEALDRVGEAGVEVVEVEREFWGSKATISDPDGYRIDLFQPPRA